MGPTGPISLVRHATIPPDLLSRKTNNMSAMPDVSKIFRASKPRLWFPWLFAFVVAGLILWIAIALMSRFGLFDIPEDDSGTKALAASLGIIGAVLSAVVTLIGIVFKYSIDDRNAQTAAQAQESNRTDVAIRAVNLLCENNKDTTPHQIGGALLALVSLGELELAVSLLGTLWPAKLLSPQVADTILSRALSEGSERVKISAATILQQNADQIMDGVAYIWPLPDVGWRSDLPEDCRYSLACAASEWLVLELKDYPNELPQAALVLHQALTDVPRVSEIAVATLRPLQILPPGYGAGTATYRLTIREISETLKGYSDVFVGFEARDLRKRVQTVLALNDSEPTQPEQCNDD